MTNEYNPNIFWMTNGGKYHTKIEALEVSMRNNQSKVTFNYYNDGFAKYNWLVEPTESWDTLLRLRALQLRDENRYIRLWYSGGADSQTILNAFMDNNIFIDEIVNVRTSPVNDFDDKRGYIANQEQNLRARPYLKLIKDLIPNTKISLIDVDAEHYLNLYKSDGWVSNASQLDLADDPGMVLGTRERIAATKLLTMNADIVEIAGGDKPKVIRRDGVYYAPLVDTQFQFVNLVSNKEFYTTAEFPELHAKQCHIWKEQLHNRFPDVSEDLTHDIYNPKLIDPDFKKDWYHCCRNILHYELDLGKGWGMDSPKFQSRLAQAKEYHPELLLHFLGQLKEQQVEIKPYWKEFDGLLVGVMSDAYCLGK